MLKKENKMAAQNKFSTFESSSTSMESSPNALYKLGGASALILLIYSLVTMILLVVVGGQPNNAQEGFTLLQNNRFVGFLRLDGLTILVMPLYYPLILAFYTALKKTSGLYVLTAAVLGLAGLTLFLATPSAFSWLALSDRYAAATSDIQKNQILAAGETILASDMWHGSGAILGGILLQTGMLLISLRMRNGKTFGQWISYTGIVMFGVDLAHLVIGFIFPPVGIALMVIAGPLYLIWFPLVAIRFFQLASEYQKSNSVVE
jgi:hypothetical protein